ncbi:MAG: GGDEF domain-containing protein [Acidimicrobiales bacterium]|nr:GGDEF domain-containing protein [Acidimicrobiales bacterium]
MNRFARRLLQRDVPLDARFQRGIRAGFLVAAVLALGTLVLTEVTSTSLERDVAALDELSEQRAEVARIGSLLPVLAGAEDPALADDLRIEIGVALESVAARQITLRIDHPEIVGSDVEFDGSTMRFDQAFQRMTAEVEIAVEELADPNLAAGSRIDVVGDAAVAVTALDVSYAGAADGRAGDGLAAAGALRVIGRWVAGIGILLAAVRLLVLGRPLVSQLRTDQVMHQSVADEQQEVQMRTLVNSRLVEGLEAVDTEAGIQVALTRIVGRLFGDRPAEVLLADSSQAHLSLFAHNETLPAPGCRVQSPWSCPAVRRAGTQIFDDSEGIRTCPYLSDRSGGACSAVCVPVTFVGESMGVLHVTGEVGWTPSDFDIYALEAVAGQTAVRLGAIRSFEKAELQASTDVLTGLPNRRAVEDRLARFIATRARGAVAMADLDRFKRLNDTYGHEAGDRALRMFADVVRGAVRTDDLAGRWGGEEFVLLLPGLSAREAAEVLDRIRTDLAAACERSDGPPFTVSIGVVDTTAGDSVDALVGLADDCLYAAKEAGRDRVIVGPVSSAGDTASTHVGVMA